MAMAIKKQARQAFPKTRPAKRADYLDWIRQLPCCITGKKSVEAAHVSFASPRYGAYGRGKGTKVADQFALPLSPDEHRRQHGANEEMYWLDAGINPHELALTLWGIYSMYDEREATELASARIYSGLGVIGNVEDFPW